MVLDSRVSAGVSSLGGLGIVGCSAVEALKEDEGTKASRFVNAFLDKNNPEDIGEVSKSVFISLARDKQDGRRYFVKNGLLDITYEEFLKNSPFKLVQEFSDFSYLISKFRDLDVQGYRDKEDYDVARDFLRWCDVTKTTSIDPHKFLDFLLVCLDSVDSIDYYARVRGYDKYIVALNRSGKFELIDRRDREALEKWRLRDGSVMRYRDLISIMDKEYSRVKKIENSRE